MAKLDVKYFPFFDSVKHPVSEAGESDAFNNNGFSLMTLEISGASAINAKVQGCVNVLNENGDMMEAEDLVWVDLGMFNVQDFKLIKNVEDNGSWFVGIAGFSKIRVNIDSVSGEATVVGTMTC